MQDVEGEAVKFQRPFCREQVLFVSGLPISLPWERKWHQLEKVFSQFGLLYSLYVPGYSGDGAGYAIIQYFSTRAAATALQSTNNRLTVGSARVKVSHVASGLRN